MSKKVKQSDLDLNNPIPYKYIDADNKIYKDPYLNNNNDESSEEITKKSKKSKKSKKNKKINKGDLTEDQIYELIEEKNADIIKINKKTEKLKTKLISAVKKLNEEITENAEILYKKEPSESEIQWLKDQYESKNKSLQIEKKMNHSYKVQYTILENKLKTRNSLKESKNDVNNSESEILSNQTQSLKSLKISNKSVHVSSNLYMSLEDQINKIKNENKEILIKIGKIKDKKVSQKKEVDNIISGELDNQFKNKNDELQKLQSLKVDAVDRYNTTTKSLDMVKKKIEYFEDKIKKIQNKNTNAENEYDYNYEYNNNDNGSKDYNFWIKMIKEEIGNKTQEELLEIIKNGESTFINELKNNNKKNIQKKKKKSQDMSTDMNSNNDINKNINIINKENKKIQNKNIYKIFSILNNKNIQNSNQLNKNENLKNENEKLSKLTEDEEILKDISDIEYRELINKKQEYLETNLRLEKNIKDFLKTENSKITKVAKSIKEKASQLQKNKKKNELIQNEIKELEDIYQLSLEKEKIKAEIEEKMTFKKVENKKNEEKDVKDEDDLNIENLKKEKNKDINIDEVNKNKIPGTREEQLLFIKKKYMDEENNIIEENSNNQFMDTDNLYNNTEEKKDNDIKNTNEDNENKKEEEKEKIGEINYNALKLEQAPFKI